MSFRHNQNVLFLLLFKTFLCFTNENLLNLVKKIIIKVFNVLLSIYTYIYTIQISGWNVKVLLKYSIH